MSLCDATDGMPLCGGLEQPSTERAAALSQGEHAYLNLLPVTQSTSWWKHDKLEVTLILEGMGYLWWYDYSCIITLV